MAEVPSAATQLGDEDTKLGAVIPRRARKSASERRAAVRARIWPDVSSNELWIRTQRTGFTTIPRALPLIGRILDAHSDKGFPLFSTYLALWCWVFDEGFVEIRNPRHVAYESGFSGPRAVSLWKGRMDRLIRLGAIRTRSGLAGDHQYVLLINPFLCVERLYEGKVRDAAFHALLSRAAEVGADDILGDPDDRL